MTRKRWFIGFAVLSLLVGGGVAQAEEPTSWSVGTRTWVTSGYTKWNFQGAGINPISELRWRGTDAVIVEGNADFVEERRGATPQYVLMMSLGGGKVTDGVLIDDDFLLSNRQGRFSHTRSSVEDEGVFYVNADIGWRPLSWRSRNSQALGYLDVFVGYQYWREEYVAFGITGNLILGPGIVINQGAPSSTKVITHDYTWHSLRVGARTEVPILAGLSARAKAVLLPYNHTELQDIHHLRSDTLKQNPSFSSEANGGFGFQLDAGLSYQVWKGLSIEGGYQFSRIDSGEGDKFTRALTGTAKDRLTEIIVERGGPYFGLRYRF